MYTLLFRFLIAWVTGIVVITASMGRVADGTASSDLNAWFGWDVVLYALMSAGMYRMSLWLFHFMRYPVWQQLFAVIIVSGCWLYVNYIIFIDWHASWSTYTFRESISYTLYYSFFPVLTGSVSLGFIVEIINRKAAGKKNPVIIKSF